MEAAVFFFGNHAVWRVNISSRGTEMTKKTEEVIELKKIEIAYLPLVLTGDSPLIVHAWGDKAKREILDKQMKKAKTAKEARNPIADVINSLYWLENKPEEMTEEAFFKAIKKGARFGFPSTAFKAAAVSAGYRAGVIKNKVGAFAAFHIDGEFVEIIGKPEPREDMVRLAGPGGVADIRFRGMFQVWKAALNIKYCPNLISAEILINLFNLGGFSCGIGEWRVEKGGEFGMFHVQTEKK
jgi:hypothetical protein